MKVAVYFNLHKRLFSVVCLEKGHPMKGRVIKHTDEVDLVDVTFKVREGGRQKVLREKKKNVHAFVIGTMKPFDEVTEYFTEQSKLKRIQYNPYKYSSFVDKQENPVHNAEYAMLVVLGDSKVKSTLKAAMYING